MKQDNFMDIREQICEIGRRLWQLGFVAANDGNISVRIDEDLFLTTPTGVSKGFMTPEMILLVNSRGQKLAESAWNPSSELPLHFRCYKERDDIRAVVHAHPPSATAFAVSHIPLDKQIMPEAVLSLGSVPIAPYGTPSTDEIPDAVAPLLKKHDAVLLENHGALSVGRDLLTAYYKMETLEFYAKVTLNTMIIGTCFEIPAPKLEELIELRKKFNIPGRHPGINVIKEG